MFAPRNLALVTIALFLVYPYGRSAVVGAQERLSFIAVGQGDAVLYQIQGKNLLVDCGPRTDTFDAGRRLLIPELKRLGVRQINLLVLTHPDYDHIGGAQSVAEVFPIQKIVTTQEVLNDPRMTWLQDHESKINLIHESGSAKIAAAELQFQVGQGREDNDRSISVLATHQNRSFLLTGDLNAAEEQRLTQIWNTNVDIAKAGHHGSNSSNSSIWLTHFTPEHVIATVGRGNQFNHPHPEAVQRIKENGAAFYQTDKNGTVSFTVANNGFELEN